jgi:hypothetical protein
MFCILTAAALKDFLPKVKVKCEYAYTFRDLKTKS